MILLDTVNSIFGYASPILRGGIKGSLACSLIFFCAQPNISFAQGESSEEISIEDYMDNLEPTQNDLESIEKKKKTPRAPKTSIDDVFGEQNNTDDALPDIQNRVEISGFDGASGRYLDVVQPHDVPLEKSEEELAEEIRRESFDAALTGLFPLRPDQIKSLLSEYDTTRRTVQKPIRGIPAPQVNVATVSLDPGVAPIIVTTAVGHVTTLNILDVTGAPFPIKDVSWAGDFEVTEPEEGGHILRITPMKEEAYGNMSIRLLTLQTPVTIMLKTSPDRVQYRVDARIPEYGPFAEVGLIDGGVERVAGNALVTSILDGVPPMGSIRLRVSGVDGRTTAYNVGGLTYVRTPLTLLSPGWEQSVSSADGMNVYALNETPVLLLSDKGRLMRANLEKGSFDE